MYTFLNDNIQIFYLGNGNRRRGEYTVYMNIHAYMYLIFHIHLQNSY